MEPLPGTDAAAASGSRPGLAAWLGILLVALFCLNTAGGWVRLSGSGVAIPDWPLIGLDGGRKTLLPPFDEAGWKAVHAAWAEHQERLQARINAGEIRPVAVGRQPASLTEFRGMFLIEWFHRLLAAVVGLLALACLGTVLADRGLRRQVGGPVGAAVFLIVCQAVLGAALIGEGSSNRWLFLHQGNAALILGCVLVALLRLIDGHSAPRPMGRLGWATAIVAVLVWFELMLGGLLAASRHQLPPGGWPSPTGPASGALDNAALHYLAHPLAAAAIMVALVVALFFAFRSSAAPVRARLALAVAGSFLALQAVLGVAAAILPHGEVVVPLAHLFLGHMLFLVLVLAWWDASRVDVDQARLA